MQQNRQAIKPWYKDSALWSIPQDWEVLKIKDFANVITWNTPDTSDLSNYWDTYLFVWPWDLSDTKYIDTSAKKLSNIWFLKSRKMPKGSVLFTSIGSSIGKTWIAKFDLTANQQINTLLPNSKYSSDFIYYELGNLSGKIKMLAWEQAVPIINKSDFENIKLIFPPLPEQTAIATILSTTDTAIQQTQEIIKKLELRNKWLGQKLLNNKKWEYLPLNSFAKEISKKNKNDEDLTVLSCTKHNWLVPSLEYFGKRIFSNDLTTYKTVPLKCFAYATNHIEEWSIWYQDKYENSLISPMYTVFQTGEKINDYFLFKLLKSHKYIHEYQKRMEGSIDRRWGLRREEFAKIKVPVPSLEEQEKVMLVLDKATQQLNQHKKKLAKLQTLKKWLMQQLLTGKVRIKAK